MAAYIRGITVKQLKVTPVLFCDKLNVRIKRKLEMQEYLWTEVDYNDKYNLNILKNVGFEVRDQAHILCKKKALIFYPSAPSSAISIFVSLTKYLQTV